MITCSNCGQSAEDHVRYCPACGTQMLGESVSKDPLIGRTLNDKYRLISELGSGAMGRVYLAEHVSLRKPVAIKVLHSDLDVTEESLQRFQREGIAAGKFNHPNAIQIFDFDRDGERTVYLAMELVTGETLKAFLQREGPRPAEEAVDLIRQILSALDAAHAQGIVHRDLKPENVMVVSEPSGRRVIKVLDFGLSKLLDTPLHASLRTQTGRILGTPQYMAPEQCGPGEVDARTDLYAAGLLLYELLSGEHAFRGSTLTEVLVKLTTEQAPAIGEVHPELRVPADLEAILERALSKKPEDRFQSAAEMIEALDAVRFDVGTSRKRRKRPLPAREATPSRRGWLFAGIGAAVVLAAVWIGTSMFGGRSEAGGDGELGASTAYARVRLEPAADRTVQEAQYLGFLDEAQRALRAGDLTTALREVTEALRLPCADAEGYETRAEIFRRQGNTEVALDDLEEARRLDPASVHPLVGAGWIHFERDAFAEALEVFEKAGKEDPASAEAWVGQGAVHFVTGDWQLAEKCLRRAVELDESSYEAHVYLGRLFLDQDRASDAVEPLRKAQRVDSSRPESYALLGRALLRTGRTAEAESQLDMANQLRPGSPDVAADLAAVYLEDGRYEEARSLLEQGLDLRGDARLAGLYGATLVASRREENAVDYLQSAVDLDPDDVSAWRLLGLCQLAAGQPGSARKSFLAVRELEGPSASVDTDLALCEMALRDFRAAGEWAKSAVELDESYPEAHLVYGTLLMDYLGNPSAAAEQLREYRELGGKDSRVTAWLQELGGR